jgi:hypothetical protein
LYRTEIKGIQAWILRTGKLKELIGGSNLVEGFVAHVKARAEAVGGTHVFGAAGGVWAQFEDEGALSAFASGWLLEATDLCPGATVVQAWAEGMLDETPPRTREVVLKRLESQRQRPLQALPEPGPLTARAGRTGQAAVGRRIDGDRVLEDATMRAQWESYRREGSTDNLAVKLSCDERAVEELEKIGDRLALIHIDANGMGRRLSEGYIKELGKFSEAMSRATKLAGTRALASDDVSRPIMCRPIVCGGDDFTVIVPADRALEVAERYLREFERATGETAEPLGGIKGTACAGIALIKPRWPLADAHHLAEELCAAAKRSCRGQGAPNVDPGRSGICFHRVTTALARDYGDIVANELTVRDRQDQVVRRLSLGTYVVADEKAPGATLSNLKKLVAFIGERKIPRGTLRQWLTLVRDDVKAAQWMWGRMLETLASKPNGVELRSEWNRIMQALGCDPASGWGTTFDSETGTPIGDALQWLAIAGRSSSAHKEG